MSNESFAYGSLYSSVRSHRQAPRSIEPEGYQAHSISSSAPYYGPQVTAAAGAYAASDYQSERYTQHQQPNGGAHFSWFDASVCDNGARQRRETGERDDMREGQPEGNARPNNQLIYNGSSTGSYAYGSVLNYSSDHGPVHEGTVRFPNQGASASGPNNEDMNIYIPYQPYLRSFEQSTIGSNSSQRESGHNEIQGTTDHASGAQSYKSPSQSAINPTTTAGSYSSYPSNIAVPRSNIASNGNSPGNAESAVRQKTQDNLPLRYDFVRNQSSGVQAFQDQPNQIVPPQPPAAGARKLQNTISTTQRQRTKTPPSILVHPSRVSLVHENVTKSKEPPRNHSASTLKFPSNSTQPADYPASGHRFNNSQSSQDECANPLVSEYQVTSSTFRSQTIKDKSSTISEAPAVDLRPPSPNVPTTVDPSHVYNRYHEYQRQIEAADAEHARLAALKLEREAVEAAAAALASAKALSQTMDLARLQLENERSHKIHGNMETPNHSASNPPILSNLTSTGQASNQSVPRIPQTVPGPQRELPTVDPRKVVAMEEEMRLMVEKMREYQTQDPQLFAHVWESMKSKQAPRPMQAQVPAGEDLIRTSIESQDKQSTNPVSSTAQNLSQPTAISDSVEGTRIPAKPLRKRKSHSNAVKLKQASETSQKSTTQERKRADMDADTVPNGNRNSISKPQEMQNELPHTYQKPPGNLGALTQPSSTSTIELMETPDSAQHSLTSNGLLNQILTASPGISKINQTMTTDLNPIDPAILRQPAQIAQSAVETMSKNTSTGPPVEQDATRNSLTAHEENTTGAVWPEEHRNVIANTAAKLLNTLSENAGKKIAAFQILDMLRYNPSYIELCELIEGIGFKFDRARFAMTLLAAISGVNSAPAQGAELKISQSPVNLATSKEYNAVINDPYNVTQGSCNNDMSHITHEQTKTLSVEAITPSLANSHSQIEFNKVKRSFGGPGSRGPYRKTIERMAATQDKSSSSGRRRGRRRKHGSPRMTPVSNDPFNRNNPIHPTPLDEQSFIAPGALKATTQAPLAMTDNNSSCSIEERLLVALQGGLSGETSVLASGDNPVVTKPAGLVTSTSKLQTQGTLSVGQSITGWRRYALSSPPPRGVDKEANSRQTTDKTPAITPTLTKEMAARKRTFAEIIDLTSCDTPTPIEDKSQIAGKVRRVGGTNFEREGYYDTAQEPKPPNDSFKHRQPQLTATIPTPVPKLSQSEIANQPDFAVAPLVPNPYKDFNNIVKPIDRSVALRKSRYDPKTIARDILITTARHPFQRGLNAHLDPLKARFTKVDGSSDLCTFRWDIVDPGGSSVGSANMSSISEEIRKRTPIGRGGGSSSRAILDSTELPVRRGPLRPTRGGGSNRGRAGKGLAGTQARQPALPSGLRYSSTADSEFAIVIESTTAQGSRDTVLAKGNGPNSSSLARRRGRPPSNFAATSQVITPLRKRVGRPPKNLSRGNNMRGTSPGRQVGRARTRPLSKSKPTGRPRKSDSKLATPKFIPFLCEWKDCKAELHNLDTLRRHVYSVHNNVLASGGIACQWSKCGLTRQVHDESAPKSTPNSTPEPKFIHEYHKFGDMQLFADHVERAHLIPFAWHMGDGPRGSTLDGSESDISAYLDNAQVTPSTALQVEEGGESSRIYKSRRFLERSYDPALESPLELATSEMKAKFSMGTEWKKITAPPRDEWLRFDQL